MVIFGHLFTLSTVLMETKELFPLKPEKIVIVAASSPLVNKSVCIS